MFSRDDKVKSTTKECGEAAGEGAGGGKDVHGYGGEGKGESGNTNTKYRIDVNEWDVETEVYNDIG